ncbi:hypothetical protein NX722_08860 [Endozoicomonas gorgoniicola]|uniref:Uncharacterized protein n=1 Tax=Endozoicomonas gorgoniicola TaxID=1234144 RepID=A0ABT3MUU0_9GAMM|nr:hypothetical protein [Endozoicomonas gorgoniicola]MCW7552749.1 hypothetical protein [Endozoicomonas gorgoniicola]
MNCDVFEGNCYSGGLKVLPDGVGHHSTVRVFLIFWESVHSVGLDVPVADMVTLVRL